MDTIKLSDMVKVSDRLPEKGTQCLIYSTVGGFTVTTFTDRNLTYGFTKPPGSPSPDGRWVRRQWRTGWGWRNEWEKLNNPTIWIKPNQNNWGNWVYQNISGANGARSFTGQWPTWSPNGGLPKLSGTVSIWRRTRPSIFFVGRRCSPWN
jgi:hypothetical protein